MAAQSLFRSQSWLGQYYRRMRAKLGAPKAITASAHKLARIVFHMLTNRHAYDETVSRGKNGWKRTHLTFRFRGSSGRRIYIQNKIGGF